MCARLCLLKGIIGALTGVEEGKFVPEFLRLTIDEWCVIKLEQIVLEPLMIAQRALEGELYVSNLLIAPVVFEIREELRAALLQQEGYIETRPDATNICDCLRRMLLAFVQRFGDGTPGTVVPFDTSHVRAKEGTRRQPVGITLWNML
jgi:hypothetical protein